MPLTCCLAVAGPALLHAAGGTPDNAGHLFGDLAVLVAIAAISAGTASRRVHGAASLAAGAALVAFTAPALLLGRQQWLSPAPNAHGLLSWTMRGLPSLGAAALLITVAGVLCGRFANARGLRPLPEPAHWLAGTVWVGLAAVLLGTALALAGGWGLYLAPAWIAQGLGLFWTLWAQHEPLPATPPSAAARRPGFQPGHMRAAHRTRVRGGPFVPRSGLRSMPQSGLRSALRSMLRYWTVWEGRPLAVNLTLVSPRTALVRLLGLYAWCAVVGPVIALALVFGPGAGHLWLDPRTLPPTLAKAALVLGALALALPVTLALRTGVLHGQELALPWPRLWPGLGVLAGAGLLGWLGGASAGPGEPGVLAALRCNRFELVTLALVLAVLEAVFYQGLLQTRLAELFPLWVAVAIPAVLLALSGPLAGLPLPPVPVMVLVGLWAGGSRPRVGVIGAASALWVAQALTLLTVRWPTPTVGRRAPAPTPRVGGRCPRAHGKARPFVQACLSRRWLIRAHMSATRLRAHRATCRVSEEKT